MKKFLFIAIIFFFAQISYATTHNVSSDAQIATANLDIEPGDIVVIANGSYTQQIKPYESGTSEIPIIYRIAANADVTIDTGGTDDCIFLNGRSWIIVELGEGSTFKCLDPGGECIDGDSASHNVIDGVDCSHSASYADGAYSVGTWDANSSDNVVKNCAFDKQAGTTGHDLFTNSGDRNLFKNNSFGYATHNGFSNYQQGSYVLVIENVFENPIHSNFATRGDYTLIERNIFKNAAVDCGATSCSANGWADVASRDAWEHGSFKVLTASAAPTITGVITRWNLIYSDGEHARCSITSNTDTMEHVRFYNNTSADQSIVLYMQDTATTAISDFQAINNIFAYGDDTTAPAGKGLVNATPDGDTEIENNIFYSGSMRYKSTSGSLTAIETAYSSEWSNNDDSDPKFEDHFNGDYRLQSDSPAIDAGRAHTTVLSTGSGTILLVANPYVGFTTGPPWNFQEPVLSEISSDTIYNATQDWTATINAINHGASTWTLNTSKSWVAGDEIYILKNGIMHNGSKPDLGYLEYDPGVPTGPKDAEWLLADLTEENGNFDLTCTGGICDFTTTAGALTIDENGDGYGKVTVTPDLDLTQISVIAQVNVIAFNTGWNNPIISRYDYPNGRNFTFGFGGTSHIPYVGLGYNNGDATEWQGHTYECSTGTDYWICATIDGQNKLLNYWIVNNSGTTIGTDVNNRAILSGRTWNNSESPLLIGVWESSDSYHTGYFANTTIKYARVIEGIISHTDFVNIVTSGGSSSPKASSNCFSDSSGNCLTANQKLKSIGETYCHSVTFDEAVVADEGPGTVASQVTFAIKPEAGAAINIPYYSGYNSSKWIFCDESESGQRYGAAQPASTDPISLGTITNLKDGEGNNVDKDGDTGLDNALSNIVNFDVDASQHVSQTSGAQGVGRTSNAQPVQ